MMKHARLVVVAVGALLVASWWRLRTEAARMAVGAARASWPPTGPNGSATSLALTGGGGPAPGEEAPPPPWVPPAADGSCPVGHPVKAKESSGIFHPPSGRLYARTRADRCYLDEAAAAADGFRRSQV